MLYYLAVALYVVVSFFLIIVVLLQPGKGEGMGAAFGGSSTGTVFGGRGASTVLTKMTTGSAVLFMVLSVILARAGSDRSDVSDTPAPTVTVPEATAEPTSGGEQADKAPAEAAEATPAAAPAEAPEAATEGSTP